MKDTTKKNVKLTTVKQRKSGRNFIIDIGEVIITRVKLNPKEYEALKNHFNGK